MPKSEIQEFAKILVQSVRDAAIQSCDRQRKPGVNSPIAIRWREAAVNNKIGQNVPENIMIQDCVDETVAHLLLAIDQGLLRISFTASNGKTVDLANDGLGELCGWYMGSGGWRAMFAHERFIDDFSDLR